MATWRQEPCQRHRRATAQQRNVHKTAQGSTQVPGTVISAKTKRFLLLALPPAYVALFWASDVFRVPGTGSSPWNPEAGLAVAALLFFGRQIIPLLVAVHFACIAIWAPLSNLAWTLVIALAHVGTLGVLTEVLRPQLRALQPPTVRAATQFALAAFILSASSAIMRGGVALLATDWSSAKLLQVIFTVATGNMVGLITVMPLLSGWTAFEQQRSLMQNWDRWTSLLFLLLAALCVTIFANDGIDQFKYFYLVFLPVIALAIKHGFMGASLATAFASCCMIALLMVLQYDPERVTELQALMIVLTLTGLVLGSAITELKHAFDERLRVHLRWQESQEALVRASQFSLASELAAAVSHEIAQPLAAARNYLRSAFRRTQQQKRPAQKLSADLKAAVTQIDSAASIIRQTRQYLRHDEVQKHAINIGDLVNSCVELSAPSLSKAGITLTTIVPPYLPDITGNRTQLSQVLMNIIRNAIEALADAAPRTGRIAITANDWERPGSVAVSVTDNGPGVDPSVAKTLFEPLVSTRPHGLGIGLPLCETIVRQHGGTIWLDETHADGARFVFTLPVTA